MPRNPMQDAQRNDEGKAITEATRQIRSSIVAARAKMTDLQSLRAKWDKTENIYSKDDVASLDAILGVLAQFTPAVDQFLASNLGA